jgi:hypothetical protein
VEYGKKYGRGESQTAKVTYASQLSAYHTTKRSAPIDETMEVVKGPISATEVRHVEWDQGKLAWTEDAITLLVAESMKNNKQWSVPDIHPLIDTSDKNNVVGTYSCIGGYACIPKHIEEQYPNSSMSRREDEKAVFPKVHVLDTEVGDIRLFRKPDSVKSASVDRLRGPREGEALIFVAVNPQNRREVVQSFGYATKVAFVDVDGVGPQKMSFGFTGSTLNHQCGGIYVAQSDGCVVGFHGSGTSGASSPNYFYPVTTDFIKLCQTPLPPLARKAKAPPQVAEAVYRASDVAGKDKRKFILVRRQKGETNDEALARIKKHHGENADYLVDDKWDPEHKSKSSPAESSSAESSLSFNNTKERQDFLVESIRQRPSE